MARKKASLSPSPAGEDSPIVTLAPKRKRRSPVFYSLAVLTEQFPDQYEQLIQNLAMGATLTASACAIGLNPDTLSKWIKRGTEQKRGVYADFWNRVRQAVGIASVIAEATIHKRDPMAWLRIGPRRILSNEWSDNAANEVTPSSQSNSPAAVSITIIDGKAVLPSDAITSALIELQKAGAVPAAPLPLTNDPAASSTGLPASKPQ